MKSILLFLALALSIPAISEAGGLELYSYRDEHGQLVVVDSLERIPAKFRSKAAKNFIPSFKDSKPASSKIDTSAVNKVKLSNIEHNDIDNKKSENKVYNISSSDENLDIVEAPEEIEPPDPGLETAEEITNILSKILENNRQIYNLVLSTKVISPAAKNFQTQNVAALAKITNPNYIIWKRKHVKKAQWGSVASQLIERFRTIQYTVTKWFGETPNNLLYGMPAFIEASQGHLNGLVISLDELKKLDEELIEQEKAKKKKK